MNVRMLTAMLLVITAWLGTAAAQEAPATETPPAAAQPAEADGFAANLSKWKDLISQMRALQTKYQSAGATERAELEKSHAELIAQAESLIPRLIETGEAQFRAAPNGNPEVANLLAALAADQVRNRDSYEEAARLGGLLAEHDYPKKSLYNLAGIAAFATADYDAAEKYLKKAEEAGTIDETGRKYLGEIPQYREFWIAEQELRAKEQATNDLPQVRLKTTKGDIVLELFENEAPNTVANFISLVEKKFYDNLSFHRVLGGFMAQGGCPKGDGSGGPGYKIACECAGENHRNHFRGSLSMAHAGKDTGGSQFFITFLPTGHLNGKHTVFGRVIEGLDVLSKLQRRDPDSASSHEPDRITEATVVRKREHEYAPQTMPE